MASDGRISNVLGVPLPQWIVKQLDKRSKELSASDKTNDNILFRANRSSWVRMVSSIDLVSSVPMIFGSVLNKSFTVQEVGIKNHAIDYFFKNYGISIKEPSDFAKSFVLQGGVSKYKETSNGFSYSPLGGFAESYNIAGKNETSEYGYRPMPGITSVRVQTQGKLGSIRSAEIQLKVWDKAQLDIIDALYFKLGYTMFLEWGHTSFYKDGSNKLEWGEDYSIDPFDKRVSIKEDIQNMISKNVRDSEGNYDAMLGVVTNFNFSYNQEGGYDCSIKLMSLGVLISSTKINNPRVLPDIQEEIIKKLVNTLIQIDKQRLLDEQKRADAINNDPNNPNSYPPCVRKYGNPENTLASNNGNKSLFPLAIRGTVNSKNYYFYQNGEYQTTGLSKRGRYSCEKESLFIDGVSTFLGKYTYDQYVNSASNKKLLGSNYVDSNLDIYNVIPNLDGIEYFAISKLKKFLPVLESTLKDTLKVSANIDVNKIQKLPPFTINNYSIIDLLTNAKTRKSTVVNSELGTGLGLSYNTGDSEYFSSIIYDSPKKISYFIKLRYPRQSDQSNPVKFSNGKSVSVLGAASSDIEFQDAIKQALQNPQTEWKFEKISSDFLELANAKDITRGSFRVTTKVYIQKKKVLDVTTEYLDENRQLKSITNKEEVDITYGLPIYIEFTDLSILTSFKTPENYIQPIDSVDAEQTAQNVSQAQQDYVAEQTLDVNAIQQSEALKFRSALEVMIRTIQLYSLDQSLPAIESNNLPQETDLLEKNTFSKFTKKLFSTGIFSEVLDDIAKTKNKPGQFFNLACAIYDEQMKTGTVDNKEAMLLVRSWFGFHRGLMGNKTTASELLSNNLFVNYEYIFKTYTVPYKFNVGVFEGTQVNHPVYIPLGLVIMILNHTCLLYDSNNKTKNDRPMFYIDFNNKTNLCLSTATHLSTNPYEILIPFQGTDKDFESIIEPSVIGYARDKSGNITAKAFIRGTDDNKTPTEIFTPKNKETGDLLSANLPEFKDVSQKQDNYRGRTMNILLSCDYLLKLVDTYSKNNGSGDVYAKEFLEQILFDVNKSLGDINIFRLAYDDASNTAYVTDDQFIPNLENNYFSESNKTELPLFGKGSIARNIEIRSEITSKLANMLAISANADIGNSSNLSKNADSYAFYNTQYRDRYIPNRTEVTSSLTLPTNAMVKSAIQFNNAIQAFYSEANPAMDSVGHATNYYIQRMSKIKSEDKGTRASAMIPVSLNFSIDGISGVGMGHAFTISEQFLPYSYNLSAVNPFGEEDKLNTVGFVATGLDQVIENNQWISNVRANMIYLKRSQDFERKEKLDRLMRSERGFREVPSQFTGVSVAAKKLNYTAEQIKKAVQKKGYTWYESEFKLNIVGVRNSSTKNLVTNRFDDIITVTYKEGSEIKFYQWAITTDPGAYYVKNFFEGTTSTGRMVPGQYINAYSIGIHRDKYEALVEVGSIKAFRDNNKDDVYDETNIQQGNFNMNIHKASDEDQGVALQIDNTSAGCQVFSSTQDFNNFMILVKTSRNKLSSNSFTYTLLLSDDII